MASPQLTTVTNFLNSRLSDLSKTKEIVSLLTDTTDYMAAQLSANISKSIPDTSDAAMNTAVTEVSNIVAEIVSEIPERIKSKTYLEDTLYSQFMAVTQQFMFSDTPAENLASITGMASKALATDLSAAIDTSDLVQQSVDSFISEFKGLVEQSPVPAKLDKETLSEKLKQFLSDIEQQLLDLQGRILTGKKFSTFRVEKILSTMASAKAALPLPDISPAVSKAHSLLGQVEELKDVFMELYSRKDGIFDIKQYFQNEVSPGELFKKNFSSIFSTLSSMSKGASSLPSLSDSYAIKMIADIGNKLNGSAAVVGILKNQQFASRLNDQTSTSVALLNRMKSDMEEILPPEEELDNMVYNTKALVRTAERYLAGVLTSDVVPILNQIKTEFDVAFSGLKASADTFINIVNAFDPPATADALAFMASIGNIAPAAKDALLTGALASFSNTLKSPLFLTSAGSAIASLERAAADNRDKLSVETDDMIGTLASYLSGEHKRAMMAMWISNTSAQRSRTIAALDLTVAKFIRPMELIVKTLEDKLNG